AAGGCTVDRTPDGAALTGALRLFARRYFVGAERVGQSLGGRTRLERLLLAFVRRPSGQPEDLETCPHAPVRIGKPLGIDLGHSLQGRTSQGLTPTLPQYIGRAHAPEVAHQGKNRIVAHEKPLVINNWQCKPGALQKRPKFTHVGKGGNARRDASLNLALSRSDGFAQFSQTLPANQGRQQEPIWFQGTANLYQCARQIVDELQCQCRRYQIK